MAESWASSEHARVAMKANRSRDTNPELAVRRILHSRGFRYRVDVRPLPPLRRRADIVFTRVLLAVFIDGCYWHGCDQHFVMPKSNASYWEQKITGNRNRDAATDELLREAGWTVLRFWEHEVPDEVATTIITAVQSLRLQRTPP